MSLNFLLNVLLLSCLVSFFFFVLFFCNKDKVDANICLPWFLLQWNEVEFR